MRESIAEQVQPTRRKLLELLKRHARLTADELAEHVGITSMGTRRHLATLERDGLVSHDVVQRGMGRPSYVYYLTDLADELFPKSYPKLMVELLRMLNNIEGVGPERLFMLRVRQRLERAQQQYGHLSGTELLEGLLQLLNTEGYMAEVAPAGQGQYMLYQYNCPIRRVAGEFPCACEAELFFLRRFLGRPVQRETHLLTGAAHCSYRIQLGQSVRA